MQTLKIRIQAVIALFLAAAFYVAALISAAGLVWAGYGLGTTITHIRGRGIIMIIVGALALIGAGIVVVWSILPRWQRFIAPGPELDRQKQPQLFKEIDRIAAMTGEAAPSHVYLVPDVNAFVSERGGIMGLFSTRVMGLGLPLLSNLTVAQLRSVLAHEYGHFAGGDVKLLPWINKARSAMIRTLQNLSEVGESANNNELAIATIIFGIVRAPFGLFARLYLRFTQALSRAQEIAADRLAVSLCGTTAHVEALTLVERSGLAFGAYLSQELEPLLAKGRVPPIAMGFQQFLSAKDVKKVLDASREPRVTDPYDSHPALEERLRHARELSVRVDRRPNDEDSALSLLEDLPACELELARFTTERDSLQPVSWDESGEHLVQSWRDGFELIGRAFEGLTVEQLPRKAAEIRKLLLAKEFDVKGATDQDVVQFAGRVTFLGLSLLLVDSGFRVINQPGTPTSFSREGVVVPLVEWLERFHSGEGSTDEWVAQWTGLGLADRPFPPVKDQKGSVR